MLSSRLSCSSARGALSMQWEQTISATTMLIAALALAGIGIPFINIGTAGFFSKDAIIEGAFEYAEVKGDFIPYAFAVLAALLTSIYIFRLWFMAFTGTPR